MIIRYTTYKVSEIHLLSCREGPSKVTRIAKITKLTETAKITKICHTTYKVNGIHSKGCREDPAKDTKITKVMKFTKLRNLRYFTIQLELTMSTKFIQRLVEKAH